MDRDRRAMIRVSSEIFGVLTARKLSFLGRSLPLFESYYIFKEILKLPLLKNLPVFVQCNRIPRNLRCCATFLQLDVKMLHSNKIKELRQCGESIVYFLECPSYDIHTALYWTNFVRFVQYKGRSLKRADKVCPQNKYTFQ